MPRYEDRTNDRSDRRASRESSRTSAKGKKVEKKTNYHTIFALFGSIKPGERIQVDIKPFDGGEGNIEDVLSIDEFLFFCEKLYYGEPIGDGEYAAKLTGSLWECDNKYADYSGNVRWSDEQLDELKAAYETAQGGKEPKKAVKAAAKKPRYALPNADADDEEDEDGEVETVAVPAPAKSKSRRPVEPVVEEVDEEEGTEDELPY